MRFWKLTIVALSLAAVPAAGQENPLPELFSDVIDVRVVNVEVVVTDNKGNRIHGLQARDFELRVDGQPVPIDYFTEIDGGLAKTSSDDSIGNVPSLTLDEPVGTNFLIFVDDLFAIQQRRNRVLKRLERDLTQLRPADRVAVVAFDGGNLTRITDWTGSRDEIENALLQARKRKALGLLNKFGLGHHTRRSVMAAAGTLRSFANAPGRKVMLLLIEGWDTRFDLWDPWSLWVSPFMSAGLDTLYGPLVHAANLVGYTLYPIDLPGPRPMSDALAANSPVGMGPTERTLVSLPGAFEDSPERSWHDVLRYLAYETGGLPMINSFGNKALAETAEDTRSYYWLGFEPPRNKDDRLRDIEVRVAGRRDLRVRSREHYRDMSKNTEASMLVEGALLFGASPGIESLDLQFGTPRKGGFRKIFVPIKLTIPLSDLELLPMDGQWMNELEFRIRLINDFGDQIEPPALKIPMLTPHEPMPGEIFVFETELRIRKREHRYVAAVYDPLSGELLSASGTVGP